MVWPFMLGRCECADCILGVNCRIEAVNTGKPLREAEGDVDDAIAALRYCAALAEAGRGVEALQASRQLQRPVLHVATTYSLVPLMQAPLAGQLDDSFKGSRIKYEPVGVVLGITPWNFPLSETGSGAEC